jgi:CheY-like chemotaxis protein
VTDDSAMNRKILVRIVKKILEDRITEPGVEWVVEEAENGEEAVNMFADRLAQIRGGLEERLEAIDEYAVIFMDVVSLSWTVIG